MDEPKEKLHEIAATMGVGAFHRHVFLCIGPDCCSAETGAESWETLKKELKSRGLSLSQGPNACYRSKVQCLRICAGGPIMVVYPEGTWYQGMTKDRIPLFVEQHLEHGEPIEAWVFAKNPLPNLSTDTT
jgi:(2Fe-2S) ferredoxin